MTASSPRTCVFTLLLSVLALAAAAQTSSRAMFVKLDIPRRATQLTVSWALPKG